MDNVLLVAGLACLIAAVVGGGLTAFGMALPVLQSRVRQVILGMLGITLVVIGGLPQMKQLSSKNTDVNVPVKPDHVNGAPVDPPPVKPTFVDVNGCWVHQQVPKTFFFLKQTADVVTSEGSFGHADGHFSGTNTFTMGWQMGSFQGTVNSDMITWSDGTSWKRSAPSLKACIDVSGHWAHQQLSQTFFTLTQTGDSVISEGSFGHADGHFTGPNTFTLSWQTFVPLEGTVFTGTVKDDMISWTPSATTWKRQN
jgi:hypothetical protein